MITQRERDHLKELVNNEKAKELFVLMEDLNAILGEIRAIETA